MKFLARALAVLVGSSLFMGCGTCIENNYARSARGSADYVASGMKDGEAYGAFPAVITMHNFNPFCDGYCDADGAFFALEVGPACTLQARVTSREYDDGKYSTDDFLHAGAAIMEGPCQLRLDDDRRVHGTVESGTFEVSPGSAELTFALRVQEWDGGRSPGFLKLRFEGQWQ